MTEIVNVFDALTTPPRAEVLSVQEGDVLVLRFPRDEDPLSVALSLDRIKGVLREAGHEKIPVAVVLGDVGIEIMRTEPKKGERS